MCWLFCRRQPVEDDEDNDEGIDATRIQLSSSRDDDDKNAVMYMRNRLNSKDGDNGTKQNSKDSRIQWKSNDESQSRVVHTVRENFSKTCLSSQLVDEDPITSAEIDLKPDKNNEVEYKKDDDIANNVNEELRIDVHTEDLDGLASLTSFPRISPENICTAKIIRDNTEVATDETTLPLQRVDDGPRPQGEVCFEQKANELGAYPRIGAEIDLKPDKNNEVEYRKDDDIANNVNEELRSDIHTGDLDGLASLTSIPQISPENICTAKIIRDHTEVATDETTLPLQKVDDGPRPQGGICIEPKANDLGACSCAEDDREEARTFSMLGLEKQYPPNNKRTSGAFKQYVAKAEDKSDKDDMKPYLSDESSKELFSSEIHVAVPRVDNNSTQSPVQNVYNPSFAITNSSKLIESTFINASKKYELACELLHRSLIQGEDTLAPSEKYFLTSLISSLPATPETDHALGKKAAPEISGNQTLHPCDEGPVTEICDVNPVEMAQDTTSITLDASIQATSPLCHEIIRNDEVTSPNDFNEVLKTINCGEQEHEAPLNLATVEKRSEIKGETAQLPPCSPLRDSKEKFMATQSHQPKLVKDTSPSPDLRRKFKKNRVELSISENNIVEVSPIPSFSGPTRSSASSLPTVTEQKVSPSSSLSFSSFNGANKQPRVSKGEFTPSLDNSKIAPKNSPL